MLVNRNRTRSWAAVAACSLALIAAMAACSSADESVSAGGIPGSAPGTTSGLEVTVRTVPPGGSDGSLPPSSAAPSSQEPAGEVPLATNTTIPDPNTTQTPPEPTAVPTIPASGSDPAFVDCGVVYRASGWPTTFVPSPSTFTCLADAFAAGTPARLVDREQTDGYGGAILVTTYDVLGPGSLRVTVDATQAADRPQVVTVSECTGVVAEMIRLVTSGCTVVG